MPPHPLALQAAQNINVPALIQLTQDLVRIRSVYEPASGGSEEACAQFIFKTLEHLNLTPHMTYPAPTRPNIICDWQGKGFQAKIHKTLMFEGHTDVVTEGDPATWERPPFSGEIVGDMLYGRGSADMKAGVAAAIMALESVMRTAPELTGRVRLGIVCDEEGMMLGIKHFIVQGWADEVDAAIICEPEENELCLHQKGALRVIAHATGVMAHGAMPYAGANPLPIMAAFVQECLAYQQSEQERLHAHPYLGLPWFTPTTLLAPYIGEPQHNVMPDNARLTLDIRTVPGQDHQEILNTLTHLAERVSAAETGVKLTLECIESRPWTQTPADSSIVKALEHVYPSTIKRSVRYGGVPGATDGTFLHALKGIPIVTVGPGDRTIPHQVNECVAVSELIASCRLYAAATVEFLSTT